MAADRDRITIATSAGTDVLTNKACTPVSAHWTFDTSALPVALATGIVANGGKDWFFLTIDYAFGHALEAQAARIVKAGGGRVLGEATHPQDTSDFSANLSQASLRCHRRHHPRRPSLPPPIRKRVPPHQTLTQEGAQSSFENALR